MQNDILERVLRHLISLEIDVRETSWLVQRALESGEGRIEPPSEAERQEFRQKLTTQLPETYADLGVLISITTDAEGREEAEDNDN